jgi:hypothetical protein
MKLDLKALNDPQIEAELTRPHGEADRQLIRRQMIAVLAHKTGKMMRNYLMSYRLGFRAILMTLLFGGTVMAQQAQLSGFVRDPSGALVAHATVTIRSVSTNAERSSKTDDSGSYAFPSLAAGIYQVTAEASGFEKKVIENVAIEVAAKAALNIDLTVGATTETVTVSGGQLLVNTTDASVSTVVNRQFVENLPLNGRSFQSLLTLVPGVSMVPSQGAGVGGELSVNGERTEANYFMVDGVSANTGVSAASGGTGFSAGFTGGTPSETVLGTTHSLVPLDALEEFRTTTSTYSAEYGRTPGGQFVFNTRSGANQWHGSAFEYLRNGAFDANNWFNNQSGLGKQSERQSDFGGALGGPVILPGYDGRNKTFFFAFYEGMRLNSPQAAILTGVPSRSLRQSAPASLQPILNSYPVPNRPDQGNGIAYFTAGYSSPSHIDTGGIRIDHNFSDNFHLFGRFSDSPSSNVSRDPSQLATVIGTNIHQRTFTVGATNVFSARLSNEFRFNVTQNNSTATYSLDNFGGATPFALSRIPGLGEAPDEWFIFNLFYDIHARLGIEPQATTQRQFNVIDGFSAAVGAHRLKFGIDYRRLNNTATIPPTYEFGYVVSPDEILQNRMTGIILRRNTIPMRPHYTNFSAFAMDEWRVTQRLSLSLGLRWEFNPPPGDSSGNVPYKNNTADLTTAKLAPKGAPLWHSTYDNFAPRFGLAWQLHPSPDYQTVLRAGFGVFYDLATANASQGYSGEGISASGAFAGLPFPLTSDQVNSLPPPSIAPPYDSTVFGFDPHLKLPYSPQWNVALEQSLGAKQTLTLNYVASAGRRLYVEKAYFPALLGNPNFGPASAIYLTTNGSSSDYNSLQVRFQRRLAQGLQALASYTWSHAIDDVSSNFFVFEQLRASSDFDIRHSFQAALTYDVPGRHSNPLASALLKQWSFDARISARSALPVDVQGIETLDPATGADLIYQPDRVPGQPLYVNNLNAPGGRAINSAAFSVPFDADGNPIEGNAGRNVARGFNAVQVDLAVRRDFRLTEKLGLQFRAEAFNLFNHPIFGPIYNQLTAGPELFGQAYGTLNGSLGGLNPLYQTGGPRSLQLTLRLHF